MAREASATWFFALVVVRMGDRFLLVHERKHGQTWYLPAGRVEPGEEITAAALRETLEETGVPVALDGILRIEHNPGYAMTRVRVFFMPVRTAIRRRSRRPTSTRSKLAGSRSRRCASCRCAATRSPTSVNRCCSARRSTR
jgi:8-oxo-dGTP pyrophosphatase MutT (NUDIX family)